jgi:hypothetical protein
MAMATLSRRSLVQGSMAMAAFAALSTGAPARSARAQSGAAYEVVDFGAMTVGALPAGYARPIFGDVNGITNDGTIFGRIAVSAEKLSPALWDTNGKLKRLKSGKYGGQVRAVNAAGDAVGAVYDSIGGVDDSSFSVRQLPAAWIGGELVELPMPDPEFGSSEPSGDAIGISADGVIVGNGNGYNLRWVDGQPQIIGEPENGGYNLGGVNSSGVIGARRYIFTSGDNEYAIGRLDGDQFTALTVPDDIGDPFPVAVSESGILLARSFPADVSLGMIADGDAVTLLDFRASGGSFSPVAVNDAGEVIGSWQPHAGVYATPAIWRGEGEPVPLLDLMPADSGFSFLSVTGINNDGIICGTAYDADFAEHLILLVPAE